MAKSSKKSKSASAPEVSQIVSQSDIRNGSDLAHSGLVEPKTKAGKAGKATGSAKTAAKGPGSTVRKSAVRRKGRGNETGKRGASISDDEIRLRAYFISERRMRQGLPGDSGHDWLEARRQLLAEAGTHA